MFKIIDEVCTPNRATKYSAYVDLFAREDVAIGAGETKIVPLGVKIDLDMNVIDYNFNHYTNEEQQKVKENFMGSHYLEIALRSSLAVKGLIISNGIGIIDLDYPDEIGLIVHNPLNAGEDFSTNGSLICFDEIDHSFIIKKGDKVAQCTLKEHKGYLMGYKSDFIRKGGFVSTDNKDGK